MPWFGEGNGNPLQYSCLENPKDRGAWWATVYGVAQSRTRLKQLSSSSSSWIIERARKSPKNIYFWFIDYTKASDCVDHNKLWKILKEMGIPDHLTRLLRNLYAGQEVTEVDMEQRIGSKLGMEYVKVVYCHPAYLIYMQKASCKMAGWMKCKLKSRLPGEISITSDMQMTPPLWQKEKKN